MSRPAVTHRATTFDSDRAFVERIESLLPHDAMVYQVPYTRFPEVPPLYRERFYHRCGCSCTRARCGGATEG